MAERTPLELALWPTVDEPDSGPCLLYALVDHGGAPGLLAELARHAPLRWQSMFEGTREESALEVAPILIHLGPWTTTPWPTATALTSWLDRSCKTSNAVIWLRSTWSFDAMSRALRNRLDAQLPDKMPVMLRYFDTRVLASLHQVLLPDQAAAFMGLAEQWTWLDRSGNVSSSCTRHYNEDGLIPPLRLSAAQEAALIDAAEPDAVIQLMRQVAPELCARQTPAQLHAVVSDSLSAARGYRIEAALQQALFCLTAVEHGAGFHAQAGWKARLELAARDGTEFSTLLQP
jgi:hypothetical protein